MIRFRKARAGDSSAIRSLIWRVGINPFSLNWQRFLLAVDDQDCIIGCGQIKPHADGTRELASLAVVPEMQGQGIGSQILLRLLENEPLPLYLTCRSAIGIYYEKFGFERVMPNALPPYFHRITRIASWITRFLPNAGEMWVMVIRLKTKQ